MKRRAFQAQALALAMAAVLLPAPGSIAAAASPANKNVQATRPLAQGVQTARDCSRNLGSVESPSVPEFTVTMFDLGFRPTDVTIPADSSVTLTVINDGSAVGNFAVDALNIHSADIASGSTVSIPVQAPAGDYPFYSEVPGQREAGRVGVLRAVRGATTDPAAITSRSIPPLLQEWAAAWTANDADAFAELVTSPVRVEEIPTAVTNYGDPVAIFRALTKDDKVFSEVSVSLTSGFISGNQAAATGVISGRYTGQLARLPDGANQTFAVPFAAVFDVQGGCISRIAVYYDVNALLVTLRDPFDHGKSLRGGIFFGARATP